MAIYPRAKQLLIPPGANDPRIRPRIGILHVDAGDAESLYDFFKNRSGGIESHFHIPRVKRIEQYRDTNFEADANFRANPFAISVETQGLGVDNPHTEVDEGEWSEHQLSEIKSLMLWCRTTHGIPLRQVRSWNDPIGGWGYHTLFGAPSNWTPVAKSCPGPNRKLQFHKILVPWMEQQGKESNMTEEEMEKFAELVVQKMLKHKIPAEKLNTDKDWSVEAILAGVFKNRFE